VLSETVMVSPMVRRVEGISETLSETWMDSEFGSGAVVETPVPETARLICWLGPPPVICSVQAMVPERLLPAVGVNVTSSWQEVRHRLGLQQWASRQSPDRHGVQRRQRAADTLILRNQRVGVCHRSLHQPMQQRNQAPRRCPLHHRNHVQPSAPRRVHRGADHRKQLAQQSRHGPDGFAHWLHQRHPM
jgi:hypothetical protein